jgi:hypothetical protein
MELLIIPSSPLSLLDSNILLSLVLLPEIGLPVPNEVGAPFFHNKYCMDWSGIEPKLTWREAGDRPSELSHGHVFSVTCLFAVYT